MTEPSFTWDVKPDGDSLNCQTNVCDSTNKFIKKNHMHRYEEEKYCKYHRGCLFDITNKTFMTNALLVDALSIICKELLQGNRLGLLGTDCCKMSMLEVCYQVKDFADYFVSAQNCELADGWNYKDFFNQLDHDAITPEYVAHVVIETYQNYYVQNTQEETYTQSALNLYNTDIVVNDPNKFVALWEHIKTEDLVYALSIVRQARQQCIGMCDAPYYVDLWSFYDELNQILQTSSI